MNNEVQNTFRSGMLLNDDEDVTTETLHKEHEQQGGGIVVMYSSIFGLLQVNANTNKMMKSDIHRDIFTL